MRLNWRAGIIIVIAVLPALGRATAPPRSQAQRDVPARPLTGSAIVAGAVLTTDAQPAAVRRASVTLKPADGANGWTVTTDDDGRFVIRNVPAGRYTLETSKPAWITASYGASRPGRPGTPFSVADGERMPDITIRMSRGAVITGTVVDRTGQPVPGVAVSAMRYVSSEGTGERVLRRPAGGSDSVTDDQGTFRSYGLSPGEYVVVATLRAGPPTALMDLARVTDADVQRALRGGGAGQGTGAPAPATPFVGYAPVYYPGTANAGDAQSIRLGAAEERAGVTIRLDPVPTARVEAIPSLSPDANPASLQVYLVPAQPPGVGGPMNVGRRMPDGRFVYSGVTPGTYTLLARAAPAGAGPAAAPSAPARGRGPSVPSTLYGMAEVAVDGRDVSVPLPIQPGRTVSGRVAIDGEPVDVSKEPLSVALVPARDSAALGVPAASVGTDGTFRFSGVPPGRYRLVNNSRLLDQLPLMSARTAGRDVLDTLLDVIAGEDITDLMLTFTRRVSGLSGRLETAVGRAAPDYFIIAFASDRSFWTPLSRRVRQVRPDTDGRFSVRALPAGEYFVAALTDVEPGEWNDPAFLAALVPAAVKVTVRDGEQTVQDLRIK